MEREDDSGITNFLLVIGFVQAENCY